MTRAPNVIEAEWAFLKCSQQYNEDRDPELAQKQDVRLEELDKQLARARIRFTSDTTQRLSRRYRREFQAKECSSESISITRAGRSAPMST